MGVGEGGGGEGATLVLKAPSVPSSGCIGSDTLSCDHEGLLKFMGCAGFRRVCDL